jgi:hypothetical protein
MMKGEVSPLLLGSAYQTSVDSAIAALFFLPTGPGPLALMLSTLTGHVILTLFVYGMLRRYFGPWAALALALPLVFTPPSVHTYVLHPPRQASLTLAFASFWMFDRASSARIELPGFAFGAALASLACFADPYALLFLPVLVVFAFLCALDGGSLRRVVIHRATASAAGFFIGAAPLVWLWRYPDAKHGIVGMNLGILDHNWRLLVDTCLPWALSYQAWTEQGGHWTPYAVPPLGQSIQVLGAILFVGATAFGAILLPMRRIPWEVRRIGFAGAAVCALTIAGFLGSVMVMDLFSTRYLAAIILAAPMAFAPLAWRLREMFLAPLLAPYLLSAAFNGWLGFAPWTSGARIVATPGGTAKDELALERDLSTRGVSYAMADYWVSYRLTFLYAERLIVVPKNLVEDRYAPYKDAFDAATTVAYVFDPERSRESFDSIAAQLRDRGVSFKDGEWIHEGRLTAFVVRRSK